MGTMDRSRTPFLAVLIMAALPSVLLCPRAATQQIADLRLLIRPTRDTVRVGDSLHVRFSVRNPGREWVRVVIPFEHDQTSVPVFVLDADRESAVVMARIWRHTDRQSYWDLRFETRVPPGGSVTWCALVGTVRAGPGTYPIIAGLVIGAPWERTVVTLNDSASVVVRAR